VATKAGLTRSGPGVWSPDGRPEHIRSALEGSLRRLRVGPHRPLSVPRPDPAVAFEESLGAFVEAKQAGKIRHIGLSNVTLSSSSGRFAMTEIVSVQNRYSALDRKSSSCLTPARSGGSRSSRGSRSRPVRRPWPAGRLRRSRRPTVPRRGQIALAWLLAVLAGDAADSGHLSDRAPRGERRRRRHRTERGRSRRAQSSRPQSIWLADRRPAREVLAHVGVARPLSLSARRAARPRYRCSVALRRARRGAGGARGARRAGLLVGPTSATSCTPAVRSSIAHNR